MTPTEYFAAADHHAEQAHDLLASRDPGQALVARAQVHASLANYYATRGAVAGRAPTALPPRSAPDTATGRDRRPVVLRQIAELRRRARMSQAELARVTGTGQSAISEMESGVVLPNLTTLLRVAAHFGLTVVLTPDVPEESNP